MSGLNYANCTLCPRKCGVDRTSGKLGYCGMPSHILAAKAMLHFGEEPPVTGNFGTGAVFFSGCTLKCAFCQNSEISICNAGISVSSKRLREIFETLIDDGAQSIDLVTPTHFLPSIIPALYPKLPVPVVYNCGGYERVETLKALEGLIDIYLPDMKYSDNQLASQLSKCPNYFETASAAILEMFRQTGPFVMEDSSMTRGVLIRHLVLPGYLDNTLGVLDWISSTFEKNDVQVSLMRQYCPSAALPAPLNRTVTEEEYSGAVSWMELCGLRNGWTQSALSATDEYLPLFDMSGL